MTPRTLPHRLFLALLLAAAAPFAAAQDDALTAALAALQAWEPGGDFTACEQIAALVAAAGRDPARRAEAAARLAAALEGADDAARAFLCGQLWMVCTENEADTLAPWLTDEKLSPLARYALERVPGARVDAVLLAAAEKAKGAALAGLLDSLANRGAPAHASVLAGHLADRDVAVAMAAANGLGKLGGPEAVAALEKTRAKASARLRPVVVAALAACADRAAASGNTALADQVFTGLLAPGEPPAVRDAAFRGLVRLGNAAALARLRAVLSGEDFLLRPAALGLLHSEPGAPVTEAGVAALESANPLILPRLVAALGDRGDPAALPALTPLTAHADAEVRLAALAALGKLGTAYTVTELAPFLQKDGAEREAALAALAAIRDPEANGMLRNLLLESPPETAALLAPCAVSRRAANCADVLLVHAASEHAGLRAAALRAAALRALGGLAGSEAMPQLLALLVSAPVDTRPDAERALVDAVRRWGPSEDLAAHLTAAYAKQRKPEHRAALLRVLGGTRCPGTLALVCKTARRGRRDLRLEAVAALGGWHAPESLDMLRRLAVKERRADVKAAAYDALVRLARESGGLPPEETLALHREVLALAATPEQRRAVLAAVGGCGLLEALDLVAPLKDDPATAAEARAAETRLRAKFITATVSENVMEARRVLDGTPATFWQTDGPQAPGPWIELDLTRPARLCGVTLHAPEGSGGYPRACEVYVFTDPGQPGTPVATAAGADPVTEIPFPPAEGRYL
ncbi:MAG TPA: HEAT repeat domain-containing protein, partial [Candidatus Hydrogenedentes bacterium]|nr:HEAT repeat domain-containing protein [Candidatus Hydrogenedentota bacterium]